MENRIFLAALVFLIFLVIVLSPELNLLSAGSSNGTMTVEVDLVDFTPESDRIEIEVPDHIHLGNLSKKTMKTNESKVYINNTGNVKISVTPQLKNSSEEIMSYLYFRTRKTQNGTSVPLKRIGEYSLNITKPPEGGIESEYFYMLLDLKNYNKDIDKDRIGYKSDVIFYAMAQ